MSDRAPRLTWNPAKRSMLRGYSPMPNPAGKRHKVRHSARFSGRRIRMDTDSKQPAAKRAKNHEAQLIPGVDGDRIFGFPNSIITKLRYASYFVLTGNTGARGLTVIAANGIYDPDVSGVGHQPMWHDNYAAIYNNYCVIGSKVTVTFANRSTTHSFICGICGDDDSTISTTVEALMEMNNAVSAMGGTINCEPTTLTSTYEPLMSLGVDAKDDGSYATQMGTNPVQGYYYGIWAAAADGLTTINVDIKLEVEYTVKFTELKTQSLS